MPAKRFELRAHVPRRHAEFITGFDAPNDKAGLMTLLIDIKNPNWLPDETLYNKIIRFIPEDQVRMGDAPGNPQDIEMLIVSGYQPGEALKYPNLKVVQKTGAGVENVLADRDFPDSVVLARSNAEASGKEMGEYALAFVLQEHRHLRDYRDQHARRQWASHAPPDTRDTVVAVLGLGRMGRAVARRFVENDFAVVGWSRSEKDVPGVQCHAGQDHLKSVLGVADYVISVLPSTADTIGMFDTGVFAMLKPTAIFMNIGRGDQVNEPDLIMALDNAVFAGAILDVFCHEPLPDDDPLWRHPKIQVTPHISGWSSYVVEDLAENYRRMKAGEPLMNQVDRSKGY